MAPTRKTHIVRIFDDSSGTKNKDAFVDIEVLDAVAFRAENNREVVLSLPAKDATPVIKDAVGVGAERSPADGTRLSHMKKVSSEDKKNFFAVEVLDCVAFRDANGVEWILKMPDDKAAPYNTTKRTGASGDDATRRTHTEKLSATHSEKDPKDYIQVERCDMMAFRSVNGQELVIRMPSTDDGSDPGRAASVTTPEGYDGTDDGATPPENSDPNVYFKFMKGSGGLFVNDDDKVAMGPLWWLRRVSGGEIMVLQIGISRTNCRAPGSTDNTAGPVAQFKISSDFQFASDNIEGALDDIFDAPPVMPKTSASQTPPIKLNTDHVWWTGQSNDQNETDWTVLLFFNVAKIKKDLGSSDVKVRIEFPNLQKPTTDTASGVGHYIWVTSSDNPFLFVPIHPEPDASNAFGPYPFTDVSGAANYISLWNNFSVTDLSRFQSLDPTLYAQFQNISFTPTDFPGSNGGLGFNSAGGAAAWAAAEIAAEADDIARTAAARAALGLNIHGGLEKPLGWVSFDIDFSPDPHHPPPSTPTATLTITAMDFIGKTTFNYDPNNLPLFTIPSGDKKLTKVIAHTAKFNGSFIDVTLHGDTHAFTIVEGEEFA